MKLGWLADQLMSEIPKEEPILICVQCGQRAPWIVTIEAHDDVPAFDVFKCESCSFFNWVALPSEKPN